MRVSRKAENPKGFSAFLRVIFSNTILVIFYSCCFYLPFLIADSKRQLKTRIKAPIQSGD
jgi:hypothetical protein